MIDIDEPTFREFVAEALAEIPPDLSRVMSNVEVIVADSHETEPDLLGLYEGIPLTERGDAYAGRCRIASGSTGCLCWPCARPCSTWSTRSASP